MAKILYTWELGTGYGHIAHLFPIALEMSRRGIDAFFVVKDLARAGDTICKHGYPVVQAPVWLAKPVGMPPAVTFPDILFRAGYFSSSGLTALLKAWQSIFSLIKPDLLVADHSPTALLAARGTPIPKIVVGNSFTIPPAETPLPPLTSGIGNDELVSREELAVARINQSLDNLKKPPIYNLQEIFKAKETFIFTIPELDHFGNLRQRCEYLGPATMSQSGIKPKWPQRHKKKIFVYLYPAFKGFKNVIKALGKLNVCAIVHAPGISKLDKIRLQTDTLFIYEEIIEINTVLKESDAAICHSGAGTGAAFLLAGRPVLLLPVQLEQMAIAQKIAGLGAGLMLMPDANKSDYKSAIKNILENKIYTTNAKRLAQKYKRLSHVRGIEKIANLCESLIV